MRGSFWCEKNGTYMIFVIELDTILFCKLRMKKKKDKIYTTVEFG